MGLDYELIDGQTPLDDEEKEGLRIPSVTTRGELDEFEQQNIERAIRWTMGRKFKANQILSEDFVKAFIKKCMAMCGLGLVSFEGQKRTLVSMYIRYQWSYEDL